MSEEVEGEIVEPPRRRGGQKAEDIVRRETERRKLRKIRKMAGAEAVYDDLERVPPIEIDEDGYAVRPHTPWNAALIEFTEIQRQVYFVLFWNYSGGNDTMAVQEAGVTPEVLAQWKKNPVFLRRLDDARSQIADRLLLRLSQRVGLLRMPEGAKVHDAALFGLVKKYKPDVFGEMGASPGEAPVESIPRPPKRPEWAGGTAGAQVVHGAAPI